MPLVSVLRKPLAYYCRKAGRVSTARRYELDGPGACPQGGWFQIPPSTCHEAGGRGVGKVEGPAVVVACQWTYTVMTQRRSRLKLGFSSCPSTEARCWLPVPLTGGSSGDAGPIMSRPSEPAPQVAKAI